MPDSITLIAWVLAFVDNMEQADVRAGRQMQAPDSAVYRARAINKYCGRYRPFHVRGAIACGMIAKADLEDGAVYLGNCRNAVHDLAKWNAEKGMFTYVREKFGRRYHEDIYHPEDDNGFDVFVPTKRVDGSLPTL